MARGVAILALCVCLLVCSGPAEAQKITATLRGTVTDPSGAVVPAATVIAVNDNTGLTRTTTTNTAGEYVFPELPTGLYRLKVRVQGFKEIVQTDIQLTVAANVVVNVALEVGAVTESVIVQSAALAVELTGGEVSGLIGAKQVHELPLNGRSFTQLTTLMPGVSPADNFDTKNKGLFAGVDMSVSGGAPNANLWTVDGSNNNDVGSNRTILVYPSVDAIEEFRIHRNSYGPEFGQASGAQVNIVTKSGGNDFHGTAYYFGRNDALNATDYFLNLGGRPKAVLRRNDFGYTFGGPILRDRLSFFWSQEWNIERRGVVNTALTPTAGEKAGNFSGALSQFNVDPLTGVCTTPRIPTDPRTGMAFPGNQIPAADISPAGALLVQLLPDANIAPTPANPCPNPNWVESTTIPVDWRQENIRGDWNITQNANLMVRYTQDSWENGLSAGTANGLWGEDPFPAVDSAWDQPGRVLTAKWNQSFAADMVNDFQFSYSANRITLTRSAGQQLMNQLNAAMPTIFPVNSKVYGAQRTHPTFWGPAGYPDLWHLAPWDNNQDLFIWKDDFSKVWGRHTIKSGFLTSVNRKDEIIAQPEEAGQIWGGGGIGLNGWGGGTTGHLIADLLLRNMTFGYEEQQNARDVKQRWRDIEFYAGDTWRVHPRVTVDGGIRWSFFRNPFMANDEFSSFVPALFNPALGSDFCNGILLPPGSTACQAIGAMGGTAGPNRSLVEQDNNMIAPRLGVAWDVFGDGKTAFRLGVGQFFLRDFLSPSLNVGGFNTPFNPIVEGLRFLDSAADCCSFGFIPGRHQYGLDPTALNPNTWQWNVTIEREIWPKSKWEISYVGNRGVHLTKRVNVNQVLPGDINGNGVNDRLDYIRSDSGLVGVRQFSPLGNNPIVVFTRAGDSIYHSLQTLFQTRIQRDSVLRVNYTYSRLISTDANAGGSFDNTFTYSDNTNFQLDRGLSAQHRPHVFTADLLYHLPRLEGQQAALRNILGNWQVGTIVIMSSGTALTVTQGGLRFLPGLTALGGGLSGTGRATGGGLLGNERPNRVPGEDCRASGGPKHLWLNPNAFTLVGLQLGTPGNSPRGVCQGPGVANWDLSFTKNWDVPLRTTRYFGESLKVQFRLELFNAFNTPQFRSIATGLGTSVLCFDSNVTCPYNPADPSPLPTATTVTNAPKPQNFGQASRTRGPREIQYAIRFIW